jgi:hypothetical protein
MEIHRRHDDGSDVSDDVIVGLRKESFIHLIDGF